MAKNGEIDAHGFNWKFFVNFEVIFDLDDENYPRKKIHVSVTRLKFS